MFTVVPRTFDHFNSVDLGVLDGTGNKVDAQGPVVDGGRESSLDGDVHASGRSLNVKVRKDLLAVDRDAENALAGTSDISFRKIEAHVVVAVGDGDGVAKRGAGAAVTLGPINLWIGSTGDRVGIRVGGAAREVLVGEPGIAVRVRTKGRSRLC